jgi:hypothetical protein
MTSVTKAQMYKTAFMLVDYAGITRGTCVRIAWYHRDFHGTDWYLVDGALGAPMGVPAHVLTDFLL